MTDQLINMSINETINQYPDSVLCKDCLGEKQSLLNLQTSMTDVELQQKKHELTFNPCSICRQSLQDDK